MKQVSKRPSSPPAGPARQPLALMQALEPRIMFDAAIGATAIDVAHTEPSPTLTEAHEPAAIDVSPSVPVAQTRQEIAFVDTSVSNYASLVDGLGPNIEVVLVSSGQNGLQVMVDTLAGRTGVDAIHVLSHGDAGRMQLGTDWIDSAGIAAQPALLVGIGQSLAADGDILLYGCNVGAQAAGFQFVQSLAAMTQADVAASSDLTGAVARGGDWSLEVQQGVIETAAFNLAGYRGLLAADQTFDAQGVAGLGSNTVAVGDLTYFNNHAFNIAIVNDGFIAAGADHALGFRSSGPNLSTEVGFRTTDGTEFKLNSFVVDRGFGSDNSVTIAGYRNSVQITSTTLDVSGGTGTLNVSANTNWEYIDEVRITGADLDLDIDDLDFSAAVVPNSAPTIANLSGDSVAWAGTGSTVTLDASANASLTDADFQALNGGNGDWSGGSLTVQRSGTAISADTFGFNTSGALFTVSGSNLQSGGQTFATYTNTGGVLTISYTSSGTSATTALVNDVAQRITYRNDTPSGDATVRFSLSDGVATAVTADVTVSTDSIYVTNTTDTASIDLTNGVSFSEAVAIAAADATGSQTLVLSSALASQTVTLAGNLAINESLTVNGDSTSSLNLSGSTITLGGGTTFSYAGSSGTVTISSTLAGTGALAKAGAGTLSLTSTSNSAGWSGAMSVTAGSLDASAGTRLSTGTLTLNGGSFGATVTGGSAGSPVTSTFTNAVVLGAGGGTVNIGGGGGRNIADFTGVISGSGSLTKGAAAILQLSGNNTYTGATTVSFGTLIAAHNNGLGTTAAGTTVNSGATLRVASGVTVADDLSLNGTGTTIDGTNFGALHQDGGNGAVSGNVALAGAASVGATSGNSLTLSGVLSGANELTQFDAGTLVLSNTGNSSGLSGGITVSAGSLSVGADSHLGSGTVTLAGGTLLVTGATTIDNAVNLSSASTLDASANATFSGVVSGSGGLTKAGASTLTLTGTNTHTGAVTVSAGGLTLAGGSSIDNASAVTVSSGATLTVSLGGETIGSLAGAGNVSLSYGLNTGGDNTSTTFSGVISTTNTSGITKAGSGNFTLSGANTYTGSTTVSAGTLTLNGGSALADTSALSVASGATAALGASETVGSLAGAGSVSLGSFTLTAGGNATSTTFSGVLSGTGSLAKAGSGTLTLSGANTYSGTTSVSAGTLSLASDSNLGSGGLTLAAGTTLALTGATTIDNAVTLGGAATVNTGADATLAGNIGGAGSLAKTGANTLTLSGTNSYAGTTTVSAGTLSVAGDGNLGSSTVTLATGTTLVVTGANTIDNAMALSGNATVQAANAVTLSGAISGAGGLNKTGAGTVTLSGSNGFTGNVAVSAGGLTLSGGAAIDNSSAVTMSSGTTLTLSSSETIGSLAGAGSVALGANTLTTGGDNSSTTYGGNISGTGGGITKTGAGTLTLSGTNSNTGATTISAGAIDVQSGDSIGNASAVSVAAGAFLVLSEVETIGSLAGAGSVSLSNNLTTGGNNTSTTFSGDLNGSAELVKEGSGTLTLSNTGNEAVFSGGMTISAGTVSISNDDHMGSGTLTLAGGTLSLDGPMVFDNDINLAASSTINSGGNAIASGVISGAGDITKTGSLSLQFTGSNTYTGLTTVSAGYLLANNANSLGTTAGGTVVTSGATLYLSGSFSLAEALSLAGTGMLGNGAIYAPSGSDTVSGLVTLTGNTTLVHDGDLTFSGGITDGAGSYSLTKLGTGTLTLSGTASYDGTTTVSAGGLSIGSDSQLGSGALTLATGTTLAVTGATTIDNAIVLSGGTATVNTSANSTFSGNITGAGGLTKAGASTLTLGGTDSYTGATVVNAGSLLVNGALSATSNTTVASGATLGGSGSLSSNLTVNSGGTLSPGVSPGTLTVNGNLTMASGSTLAVEINGTTAGTQYDQVIVNGTVDVSGATLSVTHGYTPGSGDSYTLIVNDAADAVTGSFAGVSEGGSFLAGGNSTPLTASYVGATGNDLTLTAPLNPTITSVSSATADGTYGIGSTVTVQVNFSEAVFLSTGTVELVLETGTTDRALSYVSGSGSSTLYFSYTVQAGDVSADLDYIGTAALVANGDTIQSGGFIDANLTLPTPGAAGSLGANKALVIDGVRPTANIVVDDTALTVGETSLVTITFSEAVSGFSNTDLTVANGTLSTVSSADGGRTWTATFTPNASTTAATNLITLANTGVADAAGNAGTGTTDSDNVAIDTLRPTATVVVTDPVLSVGETTLVTITFNEPVTGFSNSDLTVANGGLSTVSSSDSGRTWTATFTPAASTTAATNLITLANAGVADAAGNAGTGTIDSNSYLVDTVVPTVTSVAVPANAIYVAGQNLDFTVNLSETVTVDTTNGTPRIAVTLDTGGTVYAHYLSGSGGTALVFRTTVATGQLDSTGIALGTSIEAQGGTLLDPAGNPATLALNGVAATTGVQVDAIVPTVTSVAVPANAVYVAGQNLDFTVNLSEAITVDTTNGTPRIAVTLDTGGTVYASYLSGSGGTALVFRATVTTGQLDSTGIALGTSIEAQGGTLRDPAGNPATLALNGVAATTGVQVDAIVPTVTSVAVPASASYGAGQNLDFTVNLSEAVTVDTTNGTPRIAVTLDTGGTVYASYLSGSGGTALVFRTTVATGQMDSTGITLGTSIEAQGGTLRDPAGNPATLALNGVGTTTGVQVDAIVPTITSVVAPAAGLHNAGDVLAFQVHLSEAVNVSGGSPRLEMNVGGTTAYATYVSGSGSDTLTFQYTVEAGQNDADGIAVTALDANGATWGDAAGNAPALALNGLASTAGLRVDTAAPTATSIVRVDPSPTPVSSASYTVTFSEAVSGVDATDFTLQTSNSAVGRIASVTPLSATTYTVRLDGLGGEGALRLDLNAGGTGITDLAGNEATAGQAGDPYLLEPIPVVPPQVAAPAETPAPPPPSPPSPPIAPVTLAPLGPISPVNAPTLNPPLPMAPAPALSADASTNPIVPNPFAPTPLASPLAGPSTAPSAGFVSLGLGSGGSGLQAVPDLGDFSVRPGQQVTISMPASTFTHSDRGAQVSVSVRQSNGAPLPAWLNFNAATGELSGTPPAGANLKLSLEVTARDSKGNRATSHLDVIVNSNAAPQRPSLPARPTPPEPRSQLQHPFDAAPLPGDAESTDLAALLLDALPESNTNDAPPASGRPALAAQFDAFGAKARQSERAALLGHARAASQSRPG